MQKKVQFWIAAFLIFCSGSGISGALAGGAKDKKAKPVNISALVELSAHGVACWTQQNYGKGNYWISVVFKLNSTVFSLSGAQLLPPFQAKNLGQVIVFNHLGDAYSHRGLAYDELLLEITKDARHLHLYREAENKSKEMNFLAFVENFPKIKNFPAKYFLNWENQVLHGWEEELVCEKLDGLLEQDDRTGLIRVVVDTVLRQGRKPSPLQLNHPRIGVAGN